MPRLKALDPKTATGPAKELMDTVKANMGKVPNILRTMANSPAALNAYLGFSGALKDGALSPELRECIALAVAQKNDCDYCLAAHTALGKMAGLGADEMINCRKGESTDARTAAAIRFALRTMETNGFVEEGDMAAVREAGFSDGDVAEIVAVVSLNIFTNLFNHVADTKIDFPKAPAL